MAVVEITQRLAVVEIPHRLAVVEIPHRLAVVDIPHRLAVVDIPHRLAVVEITQRLYRKVKILLLWLPDIILLQRQRLVVGLLLLNGFKQTKDTKTEILFGFPN